VSKWSLINGGFQLYLLFKKLKLSRCGVLCCFRYFALTTAANMVLLGGLYLAPGGLAAAPSNAVVTLGVSAAASLANWLFIEPKTTGLMFERYDIENKVGSMVVPHCSLLLIIRGLGCFQGLQIILANNTCTRY